MVSTDSQNLPPLMVGEGDKGPLTLLYKYFEIYFFCFRNLLHWQKCIKTVTTFLAHGLKVLKVNIAV